MKKFVLILAAAFIFGGFLISCEDDDQVEKKSPYELIKGQWFMKTYKMRGDPMPCDSSFWEFSYSESEEPPYEGIDYFSLYGDTTGTFEYEISENTDTLFVQDTMQIGGYFDGNWIILNFEEDTMAISRRYPETEWADTIEFNR